MSAYLWTAADAAAATGGEARGRWQGVGGVSIDTRSIVPGELFVALTGENRDGHDFVADALTRGAGAALVSRVPDGVAPDAPLLVVGDTLEGLRALGAAARARSRARVIAVTGSVGKTSTKEMLRAMLAAQGRVHAAEKSFNNHWGVPLTLARMAPDTDFAVIEIGMNHAGEITPLTRLARPHVAIVTTVEPVHLEHLGSIEAIADAKAEIFAGIEPGGVAVLPLDNAHYGRLAAQIRAARPVTFGRAAAADFRLDEARIAGGATVVRAHAREQALTFKIGAPGVHFAGNALAALAAVEAVGGDIVRAAMALGQWGAPEGRGHRWSIRLGPGGLDGAVTLIDESYNANPASMRAALAVLAAAEPEDGVGRVSRGRRIAFLGDMLELGPEEARHHADLARAPEMAGVDLVHCCGPRMRALWEALTRERRGEWFEDSAGLAEKARRTVDAGDVCMVKGSLGARMSRVVEALKGLGRAVDAQAREEE
ncbi:UDP-N-acetylmuramoylalanyl-D-glutamyl-2,6-diaminopimelate--D-alanyl-D-alanine ligase [Limibaculum sp. FT325]|uniref:UDP-N-acetylmuramoylalanyl-D-glutamyl-2, 6-diaminopimelate--D-alanyl-D-alanine ligase n=1 Tax=Thermohalobaculum sediminis TaxID=2939436 RepID=UPI0020BDAEF7|nr:UDP-N-acetylmuramoylalanyl-D-glutamyl-2,6-diaminopimelate--D-alanyl-D-alanine ligase [Limibaculum sediminis]MCL5777841.1 UDP-N-acetylmuramoylalanyl-D-glutamyl-2,6-diaminopimelate--D-alanyl-D-alanine ligase [Limibaculum sediminis]